MTEAVIVALISGAISLIGIIVSYKAATSKVTQTMEIQLAVMRAEIEIMKSDIKEHNHYAKMFAESMPVAQEQIKVINHRLADLEAKDA